MQLTVVIIQNHPASRFASEEAKVHADSGWDMVLENLKKLLENED